MYTCGVICGMGFPSPADDFIETKLDLNEYIVKNPSATFFVRTTGNLSKSWGIFTGDILVVDKSLQPYSGCTVVAVEGGEFVIREFKYINGKVFLLSPQFIAKEVNEEGLNIWGVVTHIIHKVR